MSDKQASSRIRPLARRLDSLSGSPSSRPSIKPKASPKPVASVSSSSAASVVDEATKTTMTVKEETLSMRDMLKQAKLREAKLDASPAPALRAKKQVIRTDMGLGKKLGAGEGLYLSQFGSSNAEEYSGSLLDTTGDRCNPVRVPFEAVDQAIEEPLLPPEDELFLMQMPSLFPTMVPPTVEGSPVVPTRSRRGAKPISSQSSHLSPTTGTPFSDIPDGRIGTLRIHKSGRAVLQIGTTAFEVSEGQLANFRTEIACVCPAEGEIILLGEANKRLVVSPVIS
jgi:hypothetical protein